jgi:hypothetical protein
MNSVAINSDIVRNTARGSWLSILDSLAPEIKTAIDNPGKRHIACPVHGGRDGFRLFRDADISGGGICNTCGSKPDGFSLLMWLRDWSFPDALMAVANVLGISTYKSHQKPIVVRKPILLKSNPKLIVEDEKLKARLHRVWKESKSIRDPEAEPVRLYLQSRGLDDSLPDWPSLRFHPNMQYRDEDGKVIGYFPAMLALVEKGNDLITIHRIFLTADGQKAPVDSPKKPMPVPSDKELVGSAIRLGKPGRVLQVTEGLENALAVIEATGMVTWSLISATLMPNFLIPSGVEKLIIWSDLDCSQTGTIAAAKLAQSAKTQGAEAIIHQPKGPIPSYAKSLDWLDVLNQHGPNKFALRAKY